MHTFTAIPRDSAAIPAIPAIYYGWLLAVFLGDFFCGIVSSTTILLTLLPLREEAADQV